MVVRDLRNRSSAARSSISRSFARCFRAAKPTPDGNDPAFVIASETSKQSVVTPPNVAPNETAVWWQWTDERIAHALEAHRFNEFQRDILAQVIAGIRDEWRDGDSAAKREFEREVGFFKREIEQVQRQVDIQIELQAQAKSLRDEITVAKDRAIEAEQMNLRRELSLLRQEIAVVKGLEALKADVAQARADVPRLPDIEARIDARQADVEGKQARLERELAKTKERRQFNSAIIALRSR